MYTSLDLREWRENKGVSIDDAASKIHVHPKTLRAYEEKLSNADFSDLLVLFDLYGIDIREVTDAALCDINVTLNDDLRELLKTVRRSRRFTHAYMAAQCGYVTASAYTNIEIGRCMAKMRTLYKIADILGITRSDMLSAILSACRK